MNYLNYFRQYLGKILFKLKYDLKDRGHSIDQFYNNDCLCFLHLFI